MGVVNKWTKQEVALLLRLNEKGAYYKEIADRLGRSESAVEMKARALGVRLMAKRSREPKSTTLCWDCKKASNSGCSWSRRFDPVPGWVAKHNPIKVAGKKNADDSYDVFDCPEFEEG